jgi:prokaryotic YEATS domain
MWLQAWTNAAATRVRNWIEWCRSGWRTQPARTIAALALLLAIVDFIKPLSMVQLGLLVVALVALSPLAERLPERLPTIFKSAKLPGGFEFEFREYERNVQVKVPETSSETLSPANFALTYTCWRAPKHDHNPKFQGHQVYRFDVKLTAAPAAMDRVERVKYLLPPAWDTSPITVTNRDTSFLLKEVTWADLLVRAEVYAREQNAPVELSCFVRLSEHGPRLS